MYKNCFYKVIDITGGRVTVQDINNDKTFDRSIKHIKKFVDPESTGICKEYRTFHTNDETRVSDKKGNIFSIQYYLKHVCIFYFCLNLFFLESEEEVISTAKPFKRQMDDLERDEGTQTERRRGRSRKVPKRLQD